MIGEDVECPRCKTTKYRNPSLVLLVNTCGHPLCEKCTEAIFAQPFAKCFQCPIPLKRANIKKQLFQDSSVERDVQVRKEVLSRFLKLQEAFASLREYNDYLEKLETVIYNKANNIDEDETRRLEDELRRPITSTSAKQHEVIKQEPYYHEVTEQDTEGPPLPELDYRFARAMRTLTTAEKAGGFNVNIAIKRALEEAFSALFSTQCECFK